MNNVIYANAMAEVIEYLKGIKEEDIKKISPEFLMFLEKNASKDYKPNIDFSKPLNEMKLTEQAVAIITFICYKYWCSSEEEKQLLAEILKENENDWEKQLNDNVSFDKKEENKLKQETNNIYNSQLPVEISKKDNIFKRLINFIKNKLKRG